ADSKHCRRCGHPYAYEAVYLGHMGRYRCPNCGRERPAPHVAAQRVVLRGMTGSEVRVRTPAGPLDLKLPLPGLYNGYHALGDADFELLAGRVRHATCSGTRAEEMALRLKYAGIDAPIAVERDLGRSLDAALADRGVDGARPLYALPTYTALLELRDLLADRGV